ncbi:MAG: DMT family transporter [Proteobacteria bacterium]|nr:DMT family transporter [Pseudomonadota bacterium]
MTTGPASAHKFVWAALAFAVLGISAGGVLARLAEAADPVVIAIWRTGLCGLLLAPGLVKLRASRRDLALCLLAGLALAAHFWTWFASLEHISVMRSVVLVTLAPIWVGLAERFLFKKPPLRRFWVGIAIALGAVVGMAWGGVGEASLTGDALAIVGGMLSSAYLLIGRSVRQRISFVPYGALVCLFAAAWLIPVALVRGLPLVGWEPSTWMALAGLALLPQLVGHVGFNFAVKYVATTTIAALLLLEPIGAGILAFVVLGEQPPLADVGFAAILLVGVGIATVGGHPGAARS